MESSGHTDAFRFEPSVVRWFRASSLTKGLAPRRFAGSYGLCQILYATATDLGFTGLPEALFVPAVNLDYGAKHLASLLIWAKGREGQALEAWNGGKGNVGSAQTRAYAAKVLAKKAGLSHG